MLLTKSYFPQSTEVAKMELNKCSHRDEFSLLHLYEQRLEISDVCEDQQMNTCTLCSCLLYIVVLVRVNAVKEVLAMSALCTSKCQGEKRV
ncbi:hypothetical protein GDO78_003638 [Eleutherodactylus coqui]|uniref:Uncharacterized protein n=1 Tax=Eleutherodactylus coqui TaxID=57060 RepID=A0A8J6K4S3_ELECQ|nr:hypothetical protein GDO78_003638 [Eleutherodactylus coqui]